MALPATVLKEEKPIYEDPTLDKPLSMYIKEVWGYPLLDPREEKHYAEFYKQTKDPVAREKLITSNLRFVIKIAKKYQNRDVSLGDLINAGNYGLVKAVETFDPSLGYKFITYAVWKIRKEIVLEIANNSRIIRLPVYRNMQLSDVLKSQKELEKEYQREPTLEEIAEDVGIPKEEVDLLLKHRKPISLDQKKADSSSLRERIANEESEQPDERVMLGERKEDIGAALKTLNDPRQEEVLMLYFGLNGYGRRFSLREIGARFGFTHEWARVEKEKALRRLRLRPISERLRSWY